MEISVKELNGNIDILNTARITVWKDSAEKEPSDAFMERIYFSEHSPIRSKQFIIEVRGVKSWLATHFVRHSLGYTPYVSTQRDDRLIQDASRDEIPQGQLVNMDIVLNSQSFINVSRKRLCNMAHKEAISLWKEVVNKLSEVDGHLSKCCVRECVYRNGICPEGSTCCKFIFTDKFLEESNKYLEGREEHVRKVGV